jgi:hypothetical protein
MTFRLTMHDRKAVAAAFLLAVETWRAGHHQAPLAETLAAAGLTRRQKIQAVVDQLDPAALRSQLSLHLAPHIVSLHDRSWATALAAVERRYGPLDAQGLPTPDPLVAARLTLLTDATADATVEAARRALLARQDPWTAAGLLTATAGLNRPQAAATASYAVAQSTAGTKSDRIAARVARLANSRLRRRATVVGWTEPSVAVGLGRLAAWRHYGDQGGLASVYAEGRVPMREWVVGANPCDICNEQNGTRVPLDGSFPVELPAHPSCQCYDVLVEVAAVEARAAA